MQILYILLSAVGILSFDVPCKKLYFFGNSIQNKALLSPLVIIGKRGMTIPLENNFYKAMIDVNTIIKGTLGDWKKNIIIAGEFSTKNNSKNLCQFQSESDEIRIYFLEVGSAKNGEFKVLFDAENSTKENIEMINKTICENCVESPKLFIKYKTITENVTQLDCISESKPPPIIKWDNSDGKSNMEVTELRNGARLSLMSVKGKKDEILICTGANILGESTASLINPASIKGQKDEVSRCAMNDKLLCNGQGKCYKDKIDDGKMFCRCDQGYSGSRCSNNPNKLSAEYLVRSPDADDKYCNKNGDGYTNVKTKRQHCLCNSMFYGESCSMKVAGPTNKKESQPNNSNILLTKDRTELQNMLDQSTSKLAIKYIIIGAVIVLAGCIIVILVIIVMCKCYYIRAVKNLKHSDDNEEKALERNSRSYEKPTIVIDKYDHGTVLLPPRNEMTKSPTNTRSPNKYNGDHRNNDYNDFSGNGIYEGVNIPLNRDSPSIRNAAL